MIKIFTSSVYRRKHNSKTYEDLGEKSVLADNDDELEELFFETFKFSPNHINMCYDGKILEYYSELKEQEHVWFYFSLSFNIGALLSGNAIDIDDIRIDESSISYDSMDFHLELFSEFENGSYINNITKIKKSDIHEKMFDI